MAYAIELVDASRNGALELYHDTETGFFIIRDYLYNQTTLFQLESEALNQFEAWIDELHLD